jgi:hypothetical protein
MQNRLRHLVALVVLAAGPFATIAQGPPEKPHWAITLGMRVEQVQRAIPTLDRVVLVPDAATYIDELARWSPAARWPVLIEDEHFASMFIRRFNPAQVVRRTAVDIGTRNARVTRDALEAVVVRSWGGDPAVDSIPEVLERHRYTPPGVVIASTNDAAWTAAVALAAGRGQPIAWLDGQYGRPNQLLEADGFASLQNAVDTLVAGAGYPYAAIGDAIETITVCRDIGGRVNISPKADAAEIRAVTDLLGRTAGGRRYAYTGWIFGDRVRCAYTAMCSLFLDRSVFRLYNTYDEPQVVRVYGMTEAAGLLSDRGFDVTTWDVPDTTLQGWLNLLPRGFTTDVLVMNSGGNSDYFVLSDKRAHCGDVPVLNVPLALHFTHSFSLKAPENLNTIGGQWLAHGVYAYIGSVDEPRLPGFVPPKVFADRCRNLVPFLIAGRKWDDSPAWKINTLGDPLMICRPPSLGVIARLPAPLVTADDALELGEHVKTLMRLAAEDETGDAIAKAVATLDLLGKDSVAIKMWQVAAQRDLAPSAAPASLGPLFRAGLTSEFVRAADTMPTRDDIDTDMIWHLLTPRLRGADEQMLVLLETSIRPCQSATDLERLAPHLTAVFGADHARAAVLRELNRTTNQRRRRELQKLLNGR